MTLPSPRYKWYSNKAFDTTQKRITQYANQFLNDTGFYPLKTKFFLLSEMAKFDYAILMFNLIFKIVIMVFMCISIMLLNSLLMIGIENKSFEIGIIRMIGETKRGIILMILA